MSTKNPYSQSGIEQLHRVKLVKTRKTNHWHHLLVIWSIGHWMAWSAIQTACLLQNCTIRKLLTT